MNRKVLQSPRRSNLSVPMVRRRALVWPILLLTVSGCATYQPRPLPHRSDLARRAPLKLDTSALGQLPLRRHTFNAADGLDMTEVAMVAVVNNPQLKVAREKARVAHAQLFAAHLLPDPQLSLSWDHPTGNGPGLTGAYGIGLSYTLNRLFTHSADVGAARLHARQLNLQLLWKEWQVAQQARTLYVQTIYQTRRRALLRHAQHLYSERYARSAAALKAGNVTLGATGNDLTALLDVDSRLYQLEIRTARTRKALNALLGLAPTVHLHLQPPGKLRFPSAQTVKEAERTVARRRPDLLALQAGYRSQEARVHAAVLAQFPALSIGLNRARDTSDVHTTGIGVTLSLPFLNGNRGQIAVQRANRAQLQRSYQARLDQVKADLALLSVRRTLTQHHRAQLATRLPELARMVKQAGYAYRARNLSALTYLNMQSTLLNKKIELADLNQALWSIRIAEDTLLAWPAGNDD